METCEAKNGEWLRKEYIHPRLGEYRMAVRPDRYFLTPGGKKYRVFQISDRGLIQVPDVLAIHSRREEAEKQFDGNGPDFVRWDYGRFIAILETGDAHEVI